LQIKENIEDDILRDHLGANDQIPSTNELVAYYGINPVTVMKGVNLLADEGIIYKKRGIGMFVSPDAKERLLAKYKSSFMTDIVSDVVKKAEQLQIAKDELKQMIDTVWEGDRKNADD
jgi:DNA-binding transcriptional regulator YhcF (GntR family)